MLDWKTKVLRVSRDMLRSVDDAGSPRQRRLMMAALTLLLAALGFVLYADRGFWFPEAEQAEAEPEAAQLSEPTPASVDTAPQPAKPARHRKSVSKVLAAATKSETTEREDPGVSITAKRTVLPPLEVEVVAGDAHHSAAPKDDSIQVRLENGSPPSAPAESENRPAASVETPAAEHVAMSADTPQVVSRSVRPGYPLLARQMKVEGSVILQALIGRDGKIQNLSVLSGPPILAHAAEEAVRQWHFKPHYLEGEAVETQANITVNFTISTN